MIISYYALNRNNDENLFVFQSLHEDTMLKEFYNRTKSKQIETNLYFLNDSVLPFISNPKILSLLETKDLESLPIVVIDDEIRKDNDQKFANYSCGDEFLIEHEFISLGSHCSSVFLSQILYTKTHAFFY